eukprot:Nk52_evm68s215 gene=Nk52_evmTU68s215
MEKEINLPKGHRKPPREQILKSLLKSEQFNGNSVLESYGDLEYWNRRYSNAASTNAQPTEYLCDFTYIEGYIKPYFCEDDTIVVIGCGNSNMGLHIAQLGYDSVINIDNSSTVITHMKKKHATNKSLRFVVMDALKLSFPVGSIDLIIDKGTLDTCLCSREGKRKSVDMIKESLRTLKPDGAMIIISSGEPNTRRPLLQNAAPDWDLEIIQIPKPPLPKDACQVFDLHLNAHFYVYILIPRKFIIPGEQEETNDNSTKSET